MINAAILGGIIGASFAVVSIARDNLKLMTTTDGWIDGWGEMVAILAIWVSVCIVGSMVGFVLGTAIWGTP